MLYGILLVSAWTSLIYELLLSSLMSTLLGSSILRFSLTIWAYLSGLWLGAYLTRYIRISIWTLIKVQLMLWLLWWRSVIMTKWLYISLLDYQSIFFFVYILIIIIIGWLAWAEAPIVGTLLKRDNDPHEQQRMSNIFTFDYLGSVIATLLFPLVLVPYYWLLYTSIITWSINLILWWVLLVSTKTWKKASIYIISCMWYLLFSWYYLYYVDTHWNKLFFLEDLVFQQQSMYQDIVITQRNGASKLFLDGHLQFNSLDEHRYHQGLLAPILPALSWKKSANVIILGGGDGLLLHHILASSWWANISVDLMDIDPLMTTIAKTHPVLTSLNHHSLEYSWLTIHNADAYRFVEDMMRQGKKTDMIIADFPDPRDIGLAKLYSKDFYSMIRRVLTPQGIFVTHAGNAFFTRESFSCVLWSIHSARSWSSNIITPYHVYIPSFGDWWFVAVGVSDFSTLSDNPLISTLFDAEYEISKTWCISTIDHPRIIYEYAKGLERFRQ